MSLVFESLALTQRLFASFMGDEDVMSDLLKILHTLDNQMVSGVSEAFP
jgi:hypothetical protein